MSDRSFGWPPFADRRNTPEFVIRDVAMAADSELAFDPAEWRDTLVLVERGRLELDCGDGQRGVFGTGAILCLAELPLRTLRTADREPVVLVAVSRSSQMPFVAGTDSPLRIECDDR